MRKLMNAADTVLAGSLDGVAASHADIVVLGPERKFVRRRVPKPGKVALLPGGGSGPEPPHARLVRRGLLHAPRPRAGFTPPPPPHNPEAADAIHPRAAFLFVVIN